jgi:hypothetical protein
MIFRILTFIVLVFIATILPTWVFGVCMILYALRYTAYELIFLSMSIDALYGFGYPIDVPYYTICTCFGLFFIEWLKPHISVYN